MSNLTTQLVVIGGGITAMGIAWDACLRGIKTVLITETLRGAVGTFNQPGILHAGGHFAMLDPILAAAAVDEIQILTRIAAGTVADRGSYFVSTSADPIAYPDLFVQACDQAGVAIEELPAKVLLEREPLLNPHIVRAFKAMDVTIDVSQLSFALESGIRQAGGKILYGHQISGIRRKDQRLISVALHSIQDGGSMTIGMDYLINASGPHLRRVAHHAQLQIPSQLARSTYMTMASRQTHSIVHRCRPGSVGSFILPNGQESIIGSIRNPVHDPYDQAIAHADLDLILAEAEILIPGIRDRRPLRAWVRVEASYPGVPPNTLDGPSAFQVIDHRAGDGVDNMLSVMDGELTCFRKVAEDSVDILTTRIGSPIPSSTYSTNLPAISNIFTPKVIDAAETLNLSPESRICDCHGISMMHLHCLDGSGANPTLEEAAQQLNLGNGSCLSIYCTTRCGGLFQCSPGEISNFVRDRWQGARSLVWGDALRQLELFRRVNLELLQLPGRDS